MDNEDSFRTWDSDNFQWMKECRCVLHDIFKLSDFRPLQRFLFMEISLSMQILIAGNLFDIAIAKNLRNL